MGAGSLDTCLGNPRVNVALAHASDPLVGVHEHDDVVLCRGGGIGSYVGDEQDMAFDVSDLHFSALPAVAFKRRGCNWTFALGCVTQMASLKMHAPRDRVEFIGKLVLLVFVLGAPGQLLRGAKPVNQHDVLPILHLRCAACHGRQEQKAGLDLRTVESLLKGSKDGPVLKSSDPDVSLLIQKFTKG